MAQASASLSGTETITQERSASPRVTLKLKKPKNDKKVKWTTETVDNENLNKKKSKCCCIYEKPRMFGESSSEDEGDNTGHCRGHKGHCYRADGGNEPGPSDGGGGMDQPSGS